MPGSKKVRDAMKGIKIGVCAVLAFGMTLSGCNDTSYTLYRNSVVDRTMRLHVASFDASDGEAYNRENCDISMGLFQRQAGVNVKYWCEKGPYRK